MLPTGAVLRKQYRPRVRVRVDDHDGSSAAQADRPAWAQRTDCYGDPLDDMPLTLVQRDVEATEQIAIRRKLIGFEIGGARDERTW